MTTQSFLTVGQLTSTRQRLPEDLLQIAYVFSGVDRIIGFYGQLGVTANNQIVVTNFLVCCTHVGVTSPAEEMTLLRRCLLDTGWTSLTEYGQETWCNHEYRLRLIAGYEEGSGQNLHVVLYLGDGLRYLNEHLQGAALRHRRMLDRHAHREPAIKAGQEAAVHVPVPLAYATAVLRGRHLAVLTGAGISVKSGIPTFSGENSLDARLSLHEPFPGEVVALMLADPATLIAEIGAFQANLLTARPNRAHSLLVSLQTAGLVFQIVTTNIDMLHEWAGSTSVISPQQFIKTQPGSEIDTLLVIGVSTDADGVVAAARSAGLRVVVADIKPPAFLKPQDWYVQEEAETILTALAHDCVTSRKFTPGEQYHPGRFNLPAIKTYRNSEENTLKAAIPDLPRLLSLVVQHNTSGNSQIHGWRHWMETAWLGLQLARQTPGVDSGLVFLFGLLHDCKRSNDSDDLQHGPQAATFLGWLEKEYDCVRLSTAQHATLTLALRQHSEGLTSADLTIGACWDADRLGLWRIDVRPNKAYLSLPYSRSNAFISMARAAMLAPLSFQELYNEYARL